MGTKQRRSIVVAIALVGWLGSASAQTTQRPLSDFINAQGTTSNFWPPFPDYFGFANQVLKSPSSTGPVAQCRFTGIDYAGLSARYLLSHIGLDVGTKVSGTVSERPLADGRAEVTVILHTTNAITFGQTCDNFGPGNPSAFGAQQTDLLANPNLAPGLSKVDMLMVFDNTAPGAPLPDLVLINVCGLGCLPPGFAFVEQDIRAVGTGPLHPSSGFPEGTPGVQAVTQTGIFLTGPFTSPKSRVAFDAFPAERVDWHAQGR